MIPQVIQSIEDVIKSLPQVDLPLGHYQLPGVYVRAMLIPKDTVLTGKIHNKECISIVAKGCIVVNSGKGAKRLEAGWIGKTDAGVKRAGVALEDTIFITVHNADAETLEEIESELVSDTFEQYQRRLT